MEEFWLELFQVDKADAQGDVIPKTAAEEAILRQKASSTHLPVTKNYDAATPPLGRVLDFDIVDGIVLARIDVGEEGAKLVKADWELAVGFTADPKDVVEVAPGRREIRALRLTQAALTKKKVGYA
jgi:hypothetical protein